MEGAQPNETIRALLAKADRLAHDADDVYGRLDMRGEIHGRHLS